MIRIREYGLDKISDVDFLLEKSTHYLNPKTIKTIVSYILNQIPKNTLLEKKVKNYKKEPALCGQDIFSELIKALPDFTRNKSLAILYSQSIKKKPRDNDLRSSLPPK